MTDQEEKRPGPRTPTQDRSEVHTVGGASCTVGCGVPLPSDGLTFPVLSPSATALSSLPQLLAPGESLTNPVRASLHLRVCFLGNPACNR